jgi:hypothetical protein
VDRFGVEPACAVIEFPVSSYYAAKKREAEPSAREIRDEALKGKIVEVWKGRKGREVYGARKVWLELNGQGTLKNCIIHSRPAHSAEQLFDRHRFSGAAASQGFRDQADDN